MTTTEKQIEQDLITKLTDLKYVHRSDIRDRDSLERNFREVRGSEPGASDRR